MKKAVIVSIVLFFTVLVSCGPAAEDRERMHTRAKVFQDSIASFIRTSMAEAEMPANAIAHDHSGTRPCPVCGQVVVDTAAARRNAQAAPTATPK